MRWLRPRRRIAIQQEEAEKQIRLVKLQADLEAARAERQIRRERAQAVLEENKIYAESVTERYLAYRRLEVLEKLAGSRLTIRVMNGVEVVTLGCDLNPDGTLRSTVE